MVKGIKVDVCLNWSVGRAESHTKSMKDRSKDKTVSCLWLNHFFFTLQMYSLSSLYSRSKIRSHSFICRVLTIVELVERVDIPQTPWVGRALFW